VKGYAYVFLRRDGAPLPPGCAGHTGWGFLLREDGTCRFGATENPSGKPFISPGGDNGGWEGEGDQAAMLAAMRARNYDAYKVAGIRNFNPSAAEAAAKAVKSAGYRAVGSNCLDHTYQVLRAYGVEDLPWLQTHPSPNDWFALFNGQYQEV
jgi:hypothetical protein